ncbi:maleylpyruvate isomerase family mycothiol-dependent enzyme [Streptomyces sp. WI04-05B]|uniref:maleylpyruvate isomerase family mycothiol-dependent enzyme n=1 Tax=Streptomyces TaxID=1883 RepID=UPI0029A4EEBF|nr:MULTISPECIES: maleylpyruvate isomerase family mycothiol-dependent enzyme [unclassified Streptomyces]MDX2541185.1 maleylpyruvate isomerase family mycothiol-dependent enzyme [Streptomyces sp. WI04-05B]MDX2585585.1 maleylpyruvate isomerase family mycothiol-dependent enzyme [Streptomyces sp. WI04-05A]MDX3751275.1 maleylpyruvate isomerase family mycothiol-dependent enzyme [Streptomyces sp. AK08-02]
MADHVRDLASLREATERLLTAAAKLNNDSMAEPSRLPGWTRGHVLAHLARNADALANVMAGRPMYASAEARDADIDRDSPRPLDVQLSDVRDSAARLQELWAATVDWSRTVELRNGVTDTVSALPFRRWAEVELHHVDLGIGYELEDLSAEFTEREITFLADRFTGHPEVPPTAITDGTRAWSTGIEAAEPEVTVTGSAPESLGWLCGRRDGAGLDVSGGALPALPPL